jgi:hypothetical protein
VVTATGIVTGRLRTESELCDVVEVRFGFSSSEAASGVFVALGTAGVTWGGAAQLIERNQQKNEVRNDDIGTPLNESDTE